MEVRVRVRVKLGVGARSADEPVGPVALRRLA